MSARYDRLSVPPPCMKPPRDLTYAELEVYGKIADTLCPGKNGIRSPSSYPEFPAWLAVAVAARSDAFDMIVGLLKSAAAQHDLDAWLRALHEEDPVAFQALSTVAAGAFLMIPAIRQAIRYPGQGRNVPKIEEAADQLGDGILDPVIGRGHFCVATPESSA
jgi:hypothetical protein